MYETFLQKIPLFSELPADDLNELCQMLHEVRLAAGETLFREGDTADMAYIIYEGELEVTKLVDGNEIRLDVQREPGIVIGESALIEESIRLATIRARKGSLLLGLGRSQVQELLNKSQTAAQIMVKTLTNRSRNIEAHVRHNERMAQLGTMTAGLAHELNNPASAVLRSASQLEAALKRAEAALLAVERLDFTAEQRQRVEALVDGIRPLAAAPPLQDALARSDMEAALEEWLDEIGVENGWELTASLVNLGLDPEKIRGQALDFTAEQLGALVGRLATEYDRQALVAEIRLGAERVAMIVNSLKGYVYLDQAPEQDVDVQAGLEDTLAVLAGRIGEGVAVRREYTADLPRISAYGSDLNQVWTHIISNALDALEGRGELVVRTGLEEQMVVVEIEDNGSGISPENLPKVFGPFFTTRPPGKGAGLGLTMCHNIVSHHQGEIGVVSENGRTVFSIRLPVGEGG